MIRGKRITLVVTGSIAVYKAAELARQLTKQEARVSVVMTKAATEFVSPMTFQVLTGNAVRTDMFHPAEEDSISHLDLADKADAILVAPATASFIAKARAGIGDDLASTVLLAAKCPVVFAPAMNVNMWENAATKENIEALRKRGLYFVDPVEGELACGWNGMGKLAEVSSVVQAMQQTCTDKDLKGVRAIVAAGPTWEWMDPIRFLSNISSGKMGYAVARIARNRGAKVELVTGPSSLEAPVGVGVHRVTTACEMHEKVFELASKQTALPMTYVFMVAAVADHRPKAAADRKIREFKNKPYSLELVPNPDILAELGSRREELAKKSGSNMKLVGFAAETGDVEELLASAKRKLDGKQVDLMVGNFAQDAFGKDTNQVWLLDKAGRQEEIATIDKELVAGKIISATLRVH